MGPHNTVTLHYTTGFTYSEARTRTTAVAPTCFRVLEAWPVVKGGVLGRGPHGGDAAHIVGRHRGAGLLRVRPVV